ncbi:MAG: hypothetical protein KGJ54_06405 [Betaproteobacteria bacterium]|nr:hypothetical protein [Betaproteobacteria bacterium]
MLDAVKENVKRDIATQVQRMRSVVRLTLNAVLCRHDDSTLGVEELQAAITLLGDQWRKINELGDVDLDEGMGWFQAKALIAVLNVKTWQMLEDNHKTFDQGEITEVEHALQLLCDLLSAPSRTVTKLAA